MKIDNFSVDFYDKFWEERDAAIALYSRVGPLDTKKKNLETKKKFPLGNYIDGNNMMLAAVASCSSRATNTARFYLNEIMRVQLINEAIK